MENSVDPNQTASSEASWSGSAVFSKKDKFELSITIEGNWGLLLTLKAPITIAADDKFCDIFSNFRKRIRYDISWESSASRRFSWNIIPYLLFLKEWQNLKLSSVANYRWRFMGQLACSAAALKNGSWSHVIGLDWMTILLSRYSLTSCWRLAKFVTKTDWLSLAGRFGLIRNKTNSTNLYPPTKGYLRETCKSQNINPIYLTLSSPSVSFRS